MLLFFEAGLRVSKEIPLNKHKGHYFQGFRARHLQVFSWSAVMHWPVGILYRIAPFHLQENASLLKPNDIDFGFYFHISMDDYDSLLGMYLSPTCSINF